MNRIFIAVVGTATIALAACSETSGPLLSPNPTPARTVTVNPSLQVAPAQQRVATASYATASPTRLSGGEISSLLSGRTIKQVDDQFVATFAPGGVIRATYYNADQTGSWQVNGSKLCQSFSDWNSGRSTCFDVLRGSGGVYRFHDTSNSDGYSFRLR